MYTYVCICLYKYISVYSAIIASLQANMHLIIHRIFLLTTSQFWKSKLPAHMLAFFPLKKNRLEQHSHQRDRLPPNLQKRHGLSQTPFFPSVYCCLSVCLLVCLSVCRLSCNMSPIFERLFCKIDPVICPIIWNNHKVE